MLFSSQNQGVYNIIYIGLLKGNKLKIIREFGFFTYFFEFSEESKIIILYNTIFIAFRIYDDFTSPRY